MGSAERDDFEKPKIVVLNGVSSVGKTSVAAALALGAARRPGAKVLVLTIDPAKRHAVPSREM